MLAVSGNTPVPGHIDGISRHVGFGVTAAVLSRIVAILSGLVLIPTLFRGLSAEEVGLWFLLGQPNLFAGLLDLGFGFALTRRIAFARAVTNGANSESIQDLVATGQRLYALIAIAVFLLLWVGGFLFLRVLEIHAMGQSMLLVTWTLMCLTHAATTRATLWNSVLTGHGYVGWDAAATAAGMVAATAAQIAAIYAGGKLLPVAALSLVAPLVTRGVAVAILRRK